MFLPHIDVSRPLFLQPFPSLKNKQIQSYILKRCLLGIHICKRKGVKQALPEGEDELKLRADKVLANPGESLEQIPSVRTGRPKG